MTIKENSFVEVEYTGKTKDGVTFDTSSKEVAQKAGVFSPKQKYAPARVCIGQGQILPGLDESLIGKKVGEEYSVDVPAEKGFGKRDVKKVQLVPMSTFKKHKVRPFPGLQVDFDGQIGVVMKISGGRVMVNFNHPLAGKDLVYDVKIVREITDATEQIQSFMNTVMQLKPEFIKVAVEGKKASVELPFQLPEQFITALSEKLSKVVTGVESVDFSFKKPEGKAAAGVPHAKGHHHEHGPNCNHG